MPGDLREPDLPRTAKVRPSALRRGWTTGTCASAAAKAATLALAGGAPVERVEVELGNGDRAAFDVERCEEVPGETWEAVVVKDAGDDPDVTDGAHLTATVGWADEPGVHLSGGRGVGTVTRPGLGLEVGGPAINPVPRRVIRAAVVEALARHDLTTERTGVRVVVSVPQGEQMAKRTTNKRLGILDGISILGTTGIVRPFSTASWRASVLQAIDVMTEQGVPLAVLTTGGRTEKAAMRLRPDLPEVAFVEVGDFTGAAVTRAVERGLPEMCFVGMVGKLTKLGSGVMMTHYTRSRVDTAYLADVTARAGGDEALVAEVAGANTARHAGELWEAAGLAVAASAVLCADVADNLTAWSRRQAEELDAEPLTAHAVLVDLDTLAPVAASPSAPVAAEVPRG